MMRKNTFPTNNLPHHRHIMEDCVVVKEIVDTVKPFNQS
jgi:hypothetical protein